MPHHPRASLLRARLLALLVLGAVLSGCVGGGAEVAPALAGTADEEPSERPLVMPDNRSGEFAAFQETNVTSNEAHRHDYWGGRERVEIIRERVGMTRYLASEGAVALLRPATGVEHLVYEGTAALEITLGAPERRGCVPVLVVDGRPVCSPGAADPAPPAQLELQYLHAASAADEWIAAGPIAFGAPLVLKVQHPTWTDMPHSTSSLWVFRLVSPDAKDLTLTFEVAIVALRAPGEIPEWPGHPEFYADGHARVVLSSQHTTVEHLAALNAGAVPERLISHGTVALHVFVNVTQVRGALPPTHWMLYFHNASGHFWNMTDPFTPETEASNTQLHWIIYVDPEGMDTPYASGSRWEFLLRGAATGPTGQSCIGGCAEYEVDYDITVVATDLPSDTYATVFSWVER